MEKQCSTVIHATPRWGENMSSLLVEARYTLPDGHMYVIEYECLIAKTEGECVYPVGQRWESYRLVIPDKEWIRTYTRPNNEMIRQMLCHMVLIDMRRNILKILRAQYQPQGCVVPSSRSFKIRLDGFPVYMDVNGKFGLVP